MSRHAKALVAASALLLTLALGAPFAALADTLPTISSETASEIGVTTAKLSAKVNPNGISGDGNTIWRIQYSPQGQASWSNANEGTIEAPASEEANPVTVEAILGFGGELQPGQEYEFRLQAENGAGQAETSAPYPTFTMDAATAPVLVAQAATSVGSTTATLHGTLDPEGGNVNPIGGPIPIFWDLQYSTDGTSWSTAGSGTIEGAQAEGSAPISLEANATGLEPNRDYQVRVHANYLNFSKQAESPGPNPNFHTEAVPPTIGPLVHSNLDQGEAAIAGYVNPHNSAITDCEFSWGPSESYGQSIPCEALPPTDNHPRQVRAVLSGLDPESTYHFMLSIDGGAGSAQSGDTSFTTLSPPTSSDNCPNAGKPGVGFLPNCRGWEMVSPQDKNGGSVAGVTFRTRAAADGSAAQFYSLAGFAGAEGMGISTDYVSRRSADPDPGNQGWSTHAITPPQEPLTVFISALGAESRYQSEFSSDFSTAVFMAASPLGAAPNVAKIINLYRRDDILDTGPGNYELLTDCFSPPAGPCENPIAIGFSLLPSETVPWIAGGSANLGHVLFQSAVKLTSDGPAPGGGRTRVYDGTGGAPVLVSVLPDGSVPSTSYPGAGGHQSAVPVSNAISSDGSRIFFTAGEGSPPIGGRLYARINARSTVPLDASERTTPDVGAPARYWDASSDGTRVFFTSEEALTDDAPAGPTKLYMWALADHDEQQSVEVDATGGTFVLSFNGRSTAPIPFDAAPAVVQGALEALEFEGHDVVAPDSVSVSGGPGSPGGTDPYLVTFGGDFAGANVAELEADGSGLTGGASTAIVETTDPVHNLTYLSGDEEPLDGDAQAISGVVGASAAGDRVYFVANTGQLVPGAPGLPAGASALYLWDKGELAFVGVLPELLSDEGLILGDVPLNLKEKQSYVTPSGDLVFPSTGGEGLLSTHGGVDYEHGGGACPIESEAGSSCRELYFYDADADELQCASCNPSGAPATALARNRFLNNQQIGGTQFAIHLSRALSDDGRYLYFSTAERLVPEDTNGVADAYVYDTTTEKPSLLSSGESPQPSFFMDASADGEDVFFTTSEPLAGWDIDGNYDLYDARVDGGFPEPPPPPPSCVGDACQQPPPNLNDPTPASSAYSGPGDQTNARRPRARCPRGKRKVSRRNGGKRCVRRHDRGRATNTNRRAGR